MRRAVTLTAANKDSACDLADLFDPVGPAGPVDPNKDFTGDIS
tara:strand:- start:420 stop:548 length:129 start_codon:yes stop_codon:yes gene_type:complete